MPVRLCADPTCANPAQYRGRCQRHARQRERGIQRAGSKIYRTRRWQRTRDRFLFEHPLCDSCGQIATDVHHRIDLAAGGNPWSVENLQGLCKSCHSRITRQRQDPT